MQHCTICESRPDLLHITIEPTTVETRLPLVEHILGQLILDRYGAYAYARRIKAFGTKRDAVRAEANFDLSPQPFPVPIDRKTFRDVSLSELSSNCVASLTQNLRYLANLASNIYGLFSVTSPTTLGRGSP
ncbi:MAG: hypothetical protein QM785_19100 [Pyrinomonadaceae bacterium]